MRHPSSTTRRLVATLCVAALALSACGDDEEDAVTTTAPAAADTTTVTTTAAPSTASTEPATTEADTTGDDTAATTVADSAPSTTGDDDMILVESVDDLPQECVDLLAEFLKLIEPSVSGIDWANATLGDFQSISDQLAPEFDDFDVREAELGCDNYDLTTDAAGLAAAKQIAEQEAPGAVGWLEFIAAITAEQSTGDAAAGPQDCAGAKAYIEGLIAEGKTMNDIPFSEVNVITQAFNVISTDCTPEETSEFFARPEVVAFSS